MASSSGSTGDSNNSALRLFSQWGGPLIAVVSIDCAAARETDDNVQCFLGRLVATRRPCREWVDSHAEEDYNPKATRLSSRVRSRSVAWAEGPLPGFCPATISDISQIAGQGASGMPQPCVQVPARTPDWLLSPAQRGEGGRGEEGPVGHTSSASSIQARDVWSHQGS
jgi:hypothetical protein